MACSNGRTIDTTGKTQAPTQSQPTKTATRTPRPQKIIKIPNFVNFINTKLESFMKFVAEAEKYKPKSVADRFVIAGGVKLCEAFVRALSPEWGFAFCDMKNDPIVRESCIRARDPIIAFAKEICETTVSESVRLKVDPGMIIAMFENESNIGKVRYDRWNKVFYIGTDIRPPPSRDRGETGIAQLLPNDYRKGTCIGPILRDGSCGGEILQGTQYDRRAYVIAHPYIQAMLGVREIAEHRDICTHDERVDADEFWTWISVYNQGRCKQDPNVYWSQWIKYATRVMKQYMNACEGTIIREDGVSRIISDVWDECAKVTEAYPRLMRQR
jgi:hypothetical protein